MITGADLDRIERDARENRPLATEDILAMVAEIRECHKERDAALADLAALQQHIEQERRLMMQDRWEP